MKAINDYLILSRMQLQMWRSMFFVLVVVQIAFTLGLVLGFGYLMPDISKPAALYLTTGTATQSIVTVGLVMLPHVLSQSKAEGRLEYFLSLPINREAYLLAQLTVVAVVAIPSAAGTVAFGAWHYGLSLSLSPLILLVVPLAILSLAGVGVMVAILSPFQQLTNAITQMVIFYVLLFAPVLMPPQQLPWLLRHTADLMPPTYVADAVRATVTSLPGTHLGKSLVLMVIFGVASTAVSSISVRHRG
jgi:ABC-2 type transport system permease protein